MRKPFFRKQTKCWYVKDAAGRFIRLDPDEETAFSLWQKMLEAGRERGDPQLTILALSSKFLFEQEQLTSRTRYKLIAHYVREFCKHHHKTRCSELTKGQVVRWVKSVESWGAWSQHDAIAIIKSMFLWGEREQYIDRTPLRNLKNPKPRSRKRILSDEEHEKMVLAARNDPTIGKEFALLLIAARCGARPQQLRELRDSNMQGEVWRFSEHKTRKQTEKDLIVYLPPCLQTLSKLLANRKGFVFRMESGAAWDKDTIGKTMRRLREKVGLGDDVVLYAYRHTFATRALQQGLSSAQVAELLGHTDSRMVEETYGHLDKAPQHMLEAAAKATKRV